MTSRKSWIDTSLLLRPGQLTKLFLEDTNLARPRKIPAAELARQAAQREPAPAPPPASRLAMPAPGAVQQPAAPAQSASRAQDPASKWAPTPRMTELPSQEPSLASRTRPDLGAPADRHSSFSNAYHDPAATNSSLTRRTGSANIVFHGQVGSGHQYIAKPVDGMWHRDRKRGAMDDAALKRWTDDQPNMANRHDATFELMSAMGAHHMVTPGMQTTMHQRHQFGGDDPKPYDDEHTRREYASSHAGQPAHVNEFMPGLKTVGDSSPAQRDKVDGEHRLHGMVAHLLFGNVDGHHENVMIHQSGHPVLIDHDMTLDSPNSQVIRSNYGADAVKSVFSPGGMLDYQAKMPKDNNGKMIPVGNNFPPRMKETLERVADGHYSMGANKLNLSPSDHAALVKNARDLLLHGVEGTLDRRIDLMAPHNANAARKQVALDAAMARQAAAPRQAPRAAAPQAPRQAAPQAAAPRQAAPQVAPQAGSPDYAAMPLRKRAAPKKRAGRYQPPPSHPGSVQRALDDIRVPASNSVGRALKGIRFGAPGDDKDK